MKIHLKGLYTLLGKLESTSQHSVVSFKVPSKDKSVVMIKVKPGKKTIESTCDAEISDKLYDFLQKSEVTNPNDSPLEIKSELSNMHSILSQATRKTMDFIRYWLRYENLREESFSIKVIYWSEDETEWKNFPFLLSCTINTDYVLPLDDHFSKIIQGYLNNDIEPFLAIRHLLRAKKEIIPRYKWIDATIAAELAIKEFFIRLRPELETLLVSLPSPPLHKLYGEVLEAYANERSPRLKELAKGAERRNKLLHRPEKENITFEEANKYVWDVEIAIYHLLSLLYPNDSFIKGCFRK